MGSPMFNFEGPFTEALTKPGYTAPPDPQRNSKAGGALQLLSKFIGGVSEGRLRKFQNEENQRSKRQQELDRTYQMVMDSKTLTDEAKHKFASEYIKFNTGQAQQAVAEGVKEHGKHSIQGKALGMFGKVIEGLAGPVPKGQKFDAKSYTELMASVAPMMSDPANQRQTYLDKAEKSIQEGTGTAKEGSYFQDIVQTPGVRDGLSLLQRYDPNRYQATVQDLRSRYYQRPAPGSTEAMAAQAQARLQRYYSGGPSTSQAPPPTRAEAAAPKEMWGGPQPGHPTAAPAASPLQNLVTTGSSATASSAGSSPVPATKAALAEAPMDPSMVMDLFSIGTTPGIGKSQERKYLQDGKPIVVDEVISSDPLASGIYSKDHLRRIDASTLTPYRAEPALRQTMQKFARPGGGARPGFWDEERKAWRFAGPNGFTYEADPKLYEKPRENKEPQQLAKEARGHLAAMAHSYSILENSITTRRDAEIHRIRRMVPTIKQEEADKYIQQAKDDADQERASLASQKEEEQKQLLEMYPQLQQQAPPESRKTLIQRREELDKMEKTWFH